MLAAIIAVAIALVVVSTFVIFCICVAAGRADEEMDRTLAERKQRDEWHRLLLRAHENRMRR